MELQKRLVTAQVLAAAPCFFGPIWDDTMDCPRCSDEPQCGVGLEVGLVLVEGALRGFLTTCPQPQLQMQN